MASSALVLVAFLGLAQLFLPGIAAQRIASMLERHATGVQVSVSAFPAVELLFGEADSVNVRIKRMVSGSSHTAHLFAEMQRVGTLNAHVDQLEKHGLLLTDVTLRKRGNAVTGSAKLSRASIQAALPINMRLVARGVASNGIAIAGTFDVLGHKVNAPVEIAAMNGKIVLRPALSGIESLLNDLSLTIFSNPALAVRGVTAAQVDGGFSASADGTFR
jgi:hypothetical protein